MTRIDRFSFSSLTIYFDPSSFFIKFIIVRSSSTQGSYLSHDWAEHYIRDNPERCVSFWIYLPQNKQCTGSRRSAVTKIPSLCQVCPRIDQRVLTFVWSWCGILFSFSLFLQYKKNNHIWLFIDDQLTMRSHLDSLHNTFMCRDTFNLSKVTAHEIKNNISWIYLFVIKKICMIYTC